MSDTVTRGIRVQVQAAYVAEKSAPADSYYFFAYTVRITNEGPETAQLVSRRWIISGPEGEIGQVEGPGVVGQQPILEPGQSFEYTSSCPLQAPLGSMHGWYRMRLASGAGFEVRIAPFSLATPAALN
jgi:ApaG protein